MMTCTKNMVKAALCFLVIFPGIGVIAQVNSHKTHSDYQEFNKILIKETSEKSTDSSGLKILRPSVLPNWICAFPGSDGKQVYALGISDPGMDEAEGFQLACLRAKTIIAVLQHPRIAGMTDNFTNEETESRTDEFVTKYENLYNIESLVTISEINFEVINRHHTAFGETIVLMRFTTGDSDPCTDTLFVQASAYEVERQKMNFFESEDRYEISGKYSHKTDSNILNNFCYSFKSLNNLVEIESIVGAKSHRFPYAVFRYAVAGGDTLKAPAVDYTFQKLNYGLWKTYFQSVIERIALLSQPLSGNLKRVTDDYSQRNQNLSRELSESQPSFLIRDIQIRNNCLALELDYLNKTNKN